MLGNRATKVLVGLDITTSSIKLIELVQSGQAYRVESYAAEPTPPNAINEKAIVDAEAVGENFNANGRIEANNIATVSPAPSRGGIGNGTLVSDDSGFVLVNVTYPQEYAYYVRVTLQATAAEVGGTEFAEALSFELISAASDFNTQNITPPGLTSPFGNGGLAPTCADTL